MMATLLEHGMPLNNLISMHNGDYRVGVKFRFRRPKDYYDAYDVIKYYQTLE